MGTPSDPLGNRAGRREPAEIILWEEDGWLMWVSKESISNIRGKKNPLNVENVVTISQDRQEGRARGWFVSGPPCVNVSSTSCSLRERSSGSRVRASICVCGQPPPPAPPLLCQPLLLYEVLLMVEAIRPAEGSVRCLLLFPALHLNLQLMVRIKGPSCGWT